jgi:hypothetical protein
MPMPAQLKQSCVEATAEEILPKFGLTYMVDDSKRRWAVTHQTPGPGLATLWPGQRLKLTLDHHSKFSLVRRYDPLA